jgi:hypothetical protein
MTRNHDAAAPTRQPHNRITESSMLFDLGRATFELGEAVRGRLSIKDALRIAKRLGCRGLVAHRLRPAGSPDVDSAVSSAPA